ncbi:MAG: flavodoxin family protein, partial [Promethearchaeota archaeon]
MVKNNNLILGICGSPRKQGTDFAVQYALQYASEKFDFDTEFWSVKNKKIQFCTHCNYCIREKKGCINNDDLQELYPLLENTKF